MPPGRILWRDRKTRKFDMLERNFTAPDGSLMALVDCDTFYASCERVARPDLLGRPVVVLSNNDGCLVAMSREAKALGLPMGEPEFQVRHLLRKHNVAVFSSNYSLYGDLSRRVMQTIASVAPEIEIYSIDEAFVRLHGALAVNATEAVALIRQRVLQWVGLPVSIGVAPTKVLAKIATKVAKKQPACHCVFDLSTYDRLDELLESVPVQDLWGIGRKSAIKLRASGIFNARQFRDSDPSFIRSMLTVRGLNMLLELKGIPAIREEIPISHSTIISSRSLGYKVTTLPPLTEAASFHAARAAEKLRAKKLLAGMVTTGIQTAYYAEKEQQYSPMAVTRLPQPTADTSAIIKAAIAGIKRVFRPDYGYAKVMVMLTDLSDPARGQHDFGEILNDTEHSKKRHELIALVDKINRVNGRGTLVFASQGQKNADWHMKRGKLSPSWTTDLSQLLKVGGEPGVYVRDSGLMP